MKLKINFQSIKFKLGLYFIIFAIVLMVVLWFLQVLFLKTFYQGMKTRQTQQVAHTIEQSYKKNDPDDFVKIVKRRDF